MNAPQVVLTLVCWACFAAGFALGRLVEALAQISKDLAAVRSQTREPGDGE